MLKRAEKPFRFSTHASLTFVTGAKAANLRQLADYLKTAPDSVIYQHTHHYLEQHQELTPEPPNDFAFWITNQLMIEDLGEKVAAIDTIQYASLEDLRKALVKLLEAHIKSHGEGRTVQPGQELYFRRSVRFSLPTKIIAHDLAEFADGLTKVTISSLYFHVFEARLRPPKGTNDFSLWMSDQLGEKQLAQQISRLDPYTQTMEGLRQRIITMIEKKIREEQRVRA